MRNLQLTTLLAHREILWEHLSQVVTHGHVTPLWFDWLLDYVQVGFSLITLFGWSEIALLGVDCDSDWEELHFFKFDVY